MITSSISQNVPDRQVATKKYFECSSLSEINSDLLSDRSDWIKEDNCPACASKKIKKFATIRHVDYGRCSACGFVFANPIPSNEALSKFYNSKFYDNYRILEESKIKKSPYFSVSHDLKNLIKYLDQDKSLNVLDFGCGPGSFVALMRDVIGYKGVEGIELNKKSIEVAKNCYNIDIASNISELKIKSYDMVTMIEVIEHVPRPLEVVESINPLLKRGGKLFLSTNSVRSVSARYFPTSSDHYTGPSHISMFTETAMLKMLERAGYKVIRMDTTLDEALFGFAVSAFLYKLDFFSPQHDDDAKDLAFIPNKIGRALRLRPSRSLPRAINLMRRVDRVVAKQLNKFSRSPFTNHMFVTAEKL